MHRTWLRYFLQLIFMWSQFSEIVEAWVQGSCSNFREFSLFHCFLKLPGSALHFYLDPLPLLCLYWVCSVQFWLRRSNFSSVHPCPGGKLSVPAPSGPPAPRERSLCICSLLDEPFQYRRLFSNRLLGPLPLLLSAVRCTDADTTPSLWLWWFVLTCSYFEVRKEIWSFSFIVKIDHGFLVCYLIPLPVLM